MTDQTQQRPALFTATAAELDKFFAIAKSALGLTQAELYERGRTFTAVDLYELWKETGRGE
jgi:hypothetical protein